MKTVAEITALRNTIKQWRQAGDTIVFVPTMGNLHQGHLSLVEKAKTIGQRVVVSIFVNPMQFGASEDIDSYPKTLQDDSNALIEAGVDLLFTPTADVIYPKGLDKQTAVTVPNVTDGHCGASRPGHFTGVSTVVCKLFNLVQPDAACFGEKDFQQLMVIRTMVEDLSMPIDVIGVPTMREASGLAMSSRNGYLTADEKQQATLLSRVLKRIKAALIDGDNDIDALQKSANDELQKGGFTPDYFNICRVSDLAVPSSKDNELVILAAAFLGKARLIDNITLVR